MNTVLKQYSSNQNLVYTSLWSDNKFISPIDKKANLFALANDMVETLNCVYSGNMGSTHPVEVIPEIAKKISDSKIQFYMIGDGGKKQKIEVLKEQYKLKNLNVLPYQSMEVFPLSLAATDIGFVTLDSSSSNLSVPSKFFSLLSVGAVIIGICKNSELAQLILNTRLVKCLKKMRLMRSVHLSTI